MGFLFSKRQQMLVPVTPVCALGWGGMGWKGLPGREGDTGWEGDDEKETSSSEILRSPSGVCADTVRFWPREGKSFEAKAVGGAEIKPWVRGMCLSTPQCAASTAVRGISMGSFCIFFFIIYF